MTTGAEVTVVVTGNAMMMSANTIIEVMGGMLDLIALINIR